MARFRCEGARLVVGCGFIVGGVLVLPGLFVCVAAAPMVVVLLVALFIGGGGRLSLDHWLISRVGRVFHGRA